MSTELGDKVISTLNCRYEICKVLGDGADAVVYLAKDLLCSQKQVAIKVTKSEHQTSELQAFMLLKQEVSIMG